MISTPYVLQLGFHSAGSILYINYSQNVCDPCPASASPFCHPTQFILISFCCLQPSSIYFFLSFGLFLSSDKAFVGPTPASVSPPYILQTSKTACTFLNLPDLGITKQLQLCLQLCDLLKH